jgi:hypothetical protein
MVFDGRRAYDAVPLMHSSSSPWKELLTDPGPDGHIVQLYRDEDFYGEAISHFAAEGIAKDESVILVATKPNWANLSGRLERKGLDVATLRRRGQLTVLDADETLPKFIVDGMPDGKTFKGIAEATIEKARDGGKFERVRWWGEMVNVLYINGNERGSTRLEELFDEVAHEQSIAIFCSFLMDKFDPLIYHGAFANLCRTHAHVIPADDYDRHRRAVDWAVSKVMGEIKGPLLKSLVLWNRDMISRMPASQALLLWIKEAVPHEFDEVLAWARKYEKEIARKRPL